MEDFSQERQTNPIKNIFINLWQIIRETIWYIFALCIALYIGLNFSMVRVSGVSMNPTYQNNDLVLVSKNTQHIEKGDIVIIDSSDFLKEKLIIKRVIAVEGDTISVKQGKVTLNGAELKETYINEPIEKMKDSYDVEETTIPKGYIFVLGDNRPFSLDSRAFGMVTIDNVQSVVCYDGDIIRGLGQIIYG